MLRGIDRKFVYNFKSISFQEIFRPWVRTVIGILYRASIAKLVIMKKLLEGWYIVCLVIVCFVNLLLTVVSKIQVLLWMQKKFCIQNLVIVIINYNQPTTNPNWISGEKPIECCRHIINNNKINQWLQCLFCEYLRRIGTVFYVLIVM